MKKLFIIILLLIAVGLIAPKIIGGIVEKEHQATFDKLNKNPAVTVDKTVFTRQWFTGKATTEITIFIQDEGVEDITLIVEENISFGPVLFTDDGLALALSYSQANINVKQLLLDEEISSSINDKVKLSALISFSKNIVAKLVIDEVSEEVDGIYITSAKAFGHFTVEDNNRLYGVFNWAGLNAKTNNESYTLGEVNFSLDQTLVAGNYYQGNAISTGDFDFSLDSIVAKNLTDNTILSLEKLLIKAKSSLTGDLLKIKMNYSADKVETAGQKLEDANLDIVFNGLNYIVMQEINMLMADNGEAIFTPEKMQKFTALIATLLVDKPIIEIKDLSVKTTEGNIESAMKISVDETRFNTANVMSIITAIEADAKGKAPMPFFTELGLSAMVDMYIEQGLVIKNEDELSVKINFSHGKLAINGKIIPM
jgi:hypothetical protein